MLPTRQSSPKALTLGMESRFALSTGEARCALSRPIPNVPQLIKVSLLQAPPPKQKIKQRKGDFSASEDHEHGPDGDDGAAAGKDPTPQYTVLPTSINDVTCAPMSAWLLQDAGPWIALQSMDGSGELRH